MGLLGGNFLAEYVVELDFEKRRVRLLDPKRYSVPREPEAPDEATLPLLRVANRPAVEIEVAGVRFPVMLDTGSPDGLIVDAELAASSEVARRPELPFRFGTVWGEVEGLRRGRGRRPGLSGASTPRRSPKTPRNGGKFAAGSRPGPGFTGDAD